jgi:hypothetical protein
MIICIGINDARQQVVRLTVSGGKRTVLAAALQREG